ncbi:MAG: homocysteine S-methyltransferase [Planctomycetota bacterium]
MASGKSAIPFKILDGGLATELEQRGHNLKDELWSSRLLLDQPEEIVDLHCKFLEAGSDIVTSASYQATIAGFERIGLERKRAAAMIVRSVELAREACQRFEGKIEGRAGEVAAGVGPFGAALADGSEYTGDYSASKRQLYDFHIERWELLVSAQPDWMLCETVPNLQEAEVLCKIAAKTSIPVWISFCCPDGTKISDGTPIGGLAELIASAGVHGIGVNCTSPKYISELVHRIRDVSEDLPIVVYPNSGETFQSETRDWAGEADAGDFATQAEAWYQAGAQIIGGCCRTTPEHIRRLRGMRAAQHVDLGSR